MRRTELLHAELLTKLKSSLVGTTYVDFYPY